jgi:hypothetical protein
MIVFFSVMTLTLSSFFRDPLADVCWTILELNVVGFAASQKTDSVLIHQGKISKVQNDAATIRFRTEQRFQFGLVFSVHSATHCKDHFAVRCPRDLEHLRCARWMFLAPPLPVARIVMAIAVPTA